jgi:hypothetical protein
MMKKSFSLFFQNLKRTSKMFFFEKKKKKKCTPGSKSSNLKNILLSLSAAPAK